MKNIIDICNSLGIEVPDDKREAFNKEVLENYKTVAEFEKKVSKLEADRDNWKEKAESANETLDKYKDVDAEGMKAEIEKYKKEAERLDADYKAKLEERDFNDALNAAMANYKFTSEAAKKSVMNELKGAGLQLRKGEIIGLDQVINQIKADDASAFVDEKKEQLEQGKAKFTSVMKDSGNGAMTKEEIMSIKDATERQAAIAANISLFKH